MGKLVFKKSGWLHSVWSCSPMSKITRWHDGHEETDLCSMAKDLAMVGLVVLVTLSLIGVMAYSLVILPILRFGVLRWLIGVAAVAAMVMGIWLLGGSRDGYRDVGPPEWWTAFRAWVAAKKGRYCPKVEFR